MSLVGFVMVLLRRMRVSPIDNGREKNQTIVISSSLPVAYEAAATGSGSRQASSVRFRGDHRQQDARGMRGIQVHGVLRDARAAVVIQRLAGIGIHIEAREVAARDVETDAVVASEEDGSRIHLDGELVRLATLQ